MNKYIKLKITNYKILIHLTLILYHINNVNPNFKSYINNFYNFFNK
jgi:hypothetical protein